jgi:hypothetical protein
MSITQRLPTGSLPFFRHGSMWSFQLYCGRCVYKIDACVGRGCECPSPVAASHRFDPLCEPLVHGRGAPHVDCCDFEPILYPESHACGKVPTRNGANGSQNWQNQNIHCPKPRRGCTTSKYEAVFDNVVLSAISLTAFKSKLVSCLGNVEMELGAFPRSTPLTVQHERHLKHLRTTLCSLIREFCHMQLSGTHKGRNANLSGYKHHHQAYCFAASAAKRITNPDGSYKEDPADLHTVTPGDMPDERAEPYKPTPSSPNQFPAQLLLDERSQATPFPGNKMTAYEVDVLAADALLNLSSSDQDRESQSDLFANSVAKSAEVQQIDIEDAYKDPSEYKAYAIHSLIDNPSRTQAY